MFAGALFVVSCLVTHSETELQTIVNSYRSTYGLQPLSLDASLCTAADGHAKFMEANNVLSHFEKPGLPEFTGEDLVARAHRVGWKDALSELVGYASTSIEDSVQAVFDSPCHRSRFLKPGALKLGVAAEGTFVCLLIGGDSEPQTVVSPAPGQKGVPASWHASSDFSGTRTGPGSRTMGYPLLFLDTTSGDGAVTAKSVELTSQTGEAVATVVRDSSNDKHFHDAIAIIPERPLEPLCTYTATVTALKADGRQITQTWKFQTGISQ